MIFLKFLMSVVMTKVVLLVMLGLMMIFVLVMMIGLIKCTHHHHLP